MNTMCNRWPRFLSALLSVTLLLGMVKAHGTGQPSGPNEEERLYNYLRTVVNAGADLFNLQGDHQSCYNLYEGSLLTVRPLLSNHPDLQKAIDDGVTKARTEKKTSVIDGAFVLRDVLREVRKKLKKSMEAPQVNKPPIPVPNKPNETKPKDKTPQDKTPKDKTPKVKPPVSPLPENNHPSVHKPNEKISIDKKTIDKTPLEKPRVGPKKRVDREPQPNEPIKKKRLKNGSIVLPGNRLAAKFSDVARDVVGHAQRLVG